MYNMYVQYGYLYMQHVRTYSTAICTYNIYLQYGYLYIQHAHTVLYKQNVHGDVVTCYLVTTIISIQGYTYDGDHITSTCSMTASTGNLTDKSLEESCTKSSRTCVTLSKLTCLDG